MQPTQSNQAPAGAGTRTASFKAYKISVALCTAVIIVGQWIFLAYLIRAYAPTLLDGDMSGWNQHMLHGHIAGDDMGNLAVFLHVFLSFIVMGLGGLQLLPWVRRRAARFHRWNGRVYLVIALLVSAAGLYMIWTRGSVGGIWASIAISLDATLIWVFGLTAWRMALRKNFSAHRRWALRLFMVVSAVWFYRVGLMFWLLANGGPVGIDMATFTGPFIVFISFAQYLLPLAIVELHLRVRPDSATPIRWLMAAVFMVCSLVLSAGIFAAAGGLWFA